MLHKPQHALHNLRPDIILLRLRILRHKRRHLIIILQIYVLNVLKHRIIVEKRRMQETAIERPQAQQMPTEFVVLFRELDLFAVQLDFVLEDQLFVQF